MYNTFNAYSSLRVIKCQPYPRPLLPWPVQSLISTMESPSFWCFWSVLPGLGLQAEAYNVFSFCLPHFTQLLRNSSVLFWLTAFHSFLLPDPSKVFIYIILDITSRLIVLQVTLLRTVLYMSILVHVSTILWGSYSVSKMTLWAQRMRGQGTPEPDQYLVLPFYSF